MQQRHPIHTYKIAENGLEWCPFYDSTNPNYFFTNFETQSLKANGKTYPTPEHYYQAQKFPLELHDQIILQPTPAKARTKAAELVAQRKGISPWSDDIAYTKMLNVIRTRIQNPQFKALLENTRNAYLYEDTYHNPSGGIPDDVWGGGRYGQGKNLLGKALMQVRNELFQSNNKDLIVNIDDIYKRAKAERTLHKMNAVPLQALSAVNPLPRISGINTEDAGLFIPTYLPYGASNDRQQDNQRQALAILNYVDSLFKKGHRKVGITYAANMGQSNVLRTPPENKNWGDIFVDQANQAEVMLVIQNLLKQNQYQHLQNVFFILPISTTPNPSANYVQGELNYLKSFLDAGNVVLGWQNQKTGKGINSGFAIGGGVVKNPPNIDLIQTTLHNFATAHATVTADLTNSPHFVETPIAKKPIKRPTKNNRDSKYSVESNTDETDEADENETIIEPINKLGGAVAESFTTPENIRKIRVTLGPDWNVSEENNIYKAKSKNSEFFIHPKKIVTQSQDVNTFIAMLKTFFKIHPKGSNVIPKIAAPNQQAKNRWIAALKSDEIKNLFDQNQIDSVFTDKPGSKQKSPAPEEHEAEPESEDEPEPEPEDEDEPESASPQPKDKKDNDRGLSDFQKQLKSLEREASVDELIKKLNYLILKNKLSDKPITYTKNEPTIASWNIACGATWVDTNLHENQSAARGLPNPTLTIALRDKRLNDCFAIIELLTKRGIKQFAIQEAPALTLTDQFYLTRGTDLLEPNIHKLSDTIATGIIGFKELEAVHKQTIITMAETNGITKPEYQLSKLEDGRPFINIHFRFQAKDVDQQRQNNFLVGLRNQFPNCVIAGDTNIRFNNLATLTNAETFGIKGALSKDVISSQNTNTQYHQAINREKPFAFNPDLDASHDSDVNRNLNRR